MARANDEDRFDLVFAPARYGALNAETEGRWTALSSADGKPLGIVWSDGADSAGFIQASRDELAEDLWQDFPIAAHLKVPAMSAYQIAKHKKGVVAEEERTGKLSEVYRDFSKLIDRLDVVTAAAATPDTDDTIPEGAHLYLTLDENDNSIILELVRSDETGMYIRDNHEWAPIDPEADNDRVWDRVIVDVTPEAAEVFDRVQAAGEIRADAFKDVVAPGEELQP